MSSDVEFAIASSHLLQLAASVLINCLFWTWMVLAIGFGLAVLWHLTSPASFARLIEILNRKGQPHP